MTRGKVWLPIEIVGPGGIYLPKGKLTGEDVAKEFNHTTSPAALERLVGFKEHRKADEGQLLSDLLTLAGQDALKNAGLTAEQLTEIIVAGTIREREEPATVAMVQRKLGASCPGYDIGLSCSGFSEGVINAARQIVLSDREERILVLGGALMDKMKVIKPQHRAIFGTAAAGLILKEAEKKDERGILASISVLYGNYSDIICLPIDENDLPEGAPEEYRGKFYMGNREVLTELAREKVKSCVDWLWAKTGLGPEDVDFAIIHQPTKTLYESAVKASGIAESKIPYNFDKYGNIVSAELPLTLGEALRAGRVKPGNLVLTVIYGAGITGVCMLWRF